MGLSYMEQFILIIGDGNKEQTTRTWEDGVRGNISGAFSLHLKHLPLKLKSTFVRCLWEKRSWYSNDNARSEQFAWEVINMNEVSM